MDQRAGIEQRVEQHIHILMKEDAPRIFSNVVSLFEKGILSPTEFIARAR